jgi:hypothetical protein
MLLSLYIIICIKIFNHCHYKCCHRRYHYHHHVPFFISIIIIIYHKIHPYHNLNKIISSSLDILFFNKNELTRKLTLQKKRILTYVRNIDF